MPSNGKIGKLLYFNIYDLLKTKKMKYLLWSKVTSMNQTHLNKYY